MSCSPFDLREYVLRELSGDARRQVDAHVRACGGCHEELERLQATRSALLALPEEEIPQRIAFVSDKIFEPSAFRRWCAAFWGSAARLGFASAAMLSIAIVVAAALSRPPAGSAPVPAAAPAAAIDTARLERELRQSFEQALLRAVAGSEARQGQRTAEMLRAAERRGELDRKAVQLAVEENLELIEKRLNEFYLAANPARTAE